MALFYIYAVSISEIRINKNCKSEGNWKPSVRQLIFSGNGYGVPLVCQPLWFLEKDCIGVFSNVLWEETIFF